MSLTTPVSRDRDAVLPGENWFFYWKTSASLWESKLKDSKGHRVIVPINWSFHSETGDQSDFGSLRPETELLRLSTLAKEMNKEVIFLLPLTPMPFLINGGVPHLLSRNLSHDHYNMVYSISDGKDGINKLYSFFDTRIYKAYSKFVSDLGKYFSMAGVGSDIYGIDCGYMEKKYFLSYFLDNSKVFSKAFSNFLQAKRELDSEKNNDPEKSLESYIKDPVAEQELKNEFTLTIKDLYHDTAKRNLLSNWMGTLKVSFIGGNREDFFNRIYSNERVSSYLKDVFYSLSNDVLPSSVLIDGKRKEKVLGQVLDDFITNTFAFSKFNESAFEESHVSIFRPLVFFNIYYNYAINEKSDHWQGLSFINFLDSDYKWSYQKLELSENKLLDLDEDNHRLTILNGKGLSSKDFSHLLKIFLNGGKIILDSNNLEPELQRRLESFIIENSLETEKINFITDITHAYLGEGRIVIFNGEKLSEAAEVKKMTFWRKLISTFEILNLRVGGSEDVEYIWRTRDSSSIELDYEEIRRVSFYNPTSYKKKMKIYLEKNFALMKIIDEVHSKVHVNNYEIDIELLPEGSVSIDFGIFS